MTPTFPDKEQLQEAVDCVTGGGVKFDSLSYEVRLQIVALTLQADIAASLDKLIDDTQYIGEWFHKSRLWDGF